MKGLICAVLIALIPAQALALSCLPHTVEAAFGQAQAAEEHFVVVNGRLDFDRSQILDKRNKHDPNPVTVAVDARLTGHSLSAGGFSTSYDKPVRVLLECYGPWCASAKPRSTVLAFVELGAQGDVIRTNPCGGYLFTTPTQEMLRAVKSCFTGGVCTPPR